jgi:hypothetical protein
VEVNLIAVCKLVGWPILGGVVHDGRDLRAGAKLPDALQPSAGVDVRDVSLVMSRM